MEDIIDVDAIEGDEVPPVAGEVIDISSDEEDTLAIPPVVPHWSRFPFMPAHFPPGDSGSDGVEDIDEISRAEWLRNRTFKVQSHGKPVAWPRPTFMNWIAKNTGVMHRRITNSAKPKVKEYRALLKKALSESHGCTEEDYPLFPNQPVFLHTIFYRPVPKADLRRISNMEEPTAIPDTKIPDSDNLLKFVMDSLNGIAYTDDAQVCRNIVDKQMDTTAPYKGRTLVMFSILRDGHQFPLMHNFGNNLD